MGSDEIGIALGGALGSVTEHWAGRELGLRIPFYCAAAAVLILFFVAIPRLNSETIERARRAAVKVDQEGD